MSPTARVVRVGATILARICSEGDLSGFLSWDVASLKKPSSAPLNLIYSPDGKDDKPSTLSVLRLMWDAYEGDGGSDECGRRIKLAVKSVFASMATMVWKTLSRAGVSICDSELDVAARTEKIEKLLMGRMTSNAFGILDRMENTVGSALYPFAHFFNHSCYPNVVAVFNDSQIHIRAVRPIYKGEEVRRGSIDSYSVKWNVKSKCFFIFPFNRCVFDCASVLNAFYLVLRIIC